MSVAVVFDSIPTISGPICRPSHPSQPPNHKLETAAISLKPKLNLIKSFDLTICSDPATEEEVLEALTSEPYFVSIFHPHRPQYSFLMQFCKTYSVEAKFTSQIEAEYAKAIFEASVECVVEYVVGRCNDAEPIWYERHNHRKLRFIDIEVSETTSGSLIVESLLTTSGASHEPATFATRQALSRKSEPVSIWVMVAFLEFLAIL